MNSVYAQGEHQTEYPDQVPQPTAPATYEKDSGPLVRIKEGVKKLVGKGTRGIGPKHSRAKPHGITGKQHAEETAKDMCGLHDAMHVGLEHERTDQHREIPIEHRGTDASDPKKLAAINREQEMTGTETGTGIGTENRTDEGSLNHIQNKMADRDLAQPSDQLLQSEAKHVSAPTTGLSEAEGTRLEGRRDLDTIEPRRDDQLASHHGAPAGTGIASISTGMTDTTGTTDIGEHQRHDGLLGDTKASHLDMRREEMRKDPAEGLTQGVKAAFIEDQRERALLGDEKFEKGRMDRSKEGETGIGQKLLAGIQTMAVSATQGIKTAATKITGHGTETTETGTHINEHGTEARKEQTL